MKLVERLSLLVVLPTPAWVFDPIQCRMHWGNSAALEMWQSPTLDDLLARDFSDTTEATRAQLLSWLDAVQRNERPEMDWTIYPHGVATPVRMTITGVPLDDGRLGLLFFAAYKERAPDPNLVRSTEALRHTSIIVALVAATGEILMRNPAAISAFGSNRPLSAWFDDIRVVPTLLEALRRGSVHRTEASSHVSGEERWYVVEGRPALDPVTGERALLMHLFDDTARRGAENLAEAKGLLVEELRQTVGLVERQRRKILELSAPILHIGRGALAVPVIGVIDDARVEELGIRLLPAVVEHGSSSVVLDLTGANALEKQGLDRLSCLVRSLQLLGTRTVLTGIRPGLAKTLVERHHEFVEAKILRSLAEGIDECRATAPVLG